MCFDSDPCRLTFPPSRVLRITKDKAAYLLRARRHFCDSGVQTLKTKSCTLLGYVLDLSMNTAWQPHGGYTPEEVKLSLSQLNVEHNISPKLGWNEYIYIYIYIYTYIYINMRVCVYALLLLLLSHILDIIRYIFNRYYMLLSLWWPTERKPNSYFRFGKLL